MRVLSIVVALVFGYLVGRMSVAPKSALVAPPAPVVVAPAPVAAPVVAPAPVAPPSAFAAVKQGLPTPATQPVPVEQIAERAAVRKESRFDPEYRPLFAKYGLSAAQIDTAI